MGTDDSFAALCSALFYLMTRHAREPTPQLAGLVREHLQWLAEHPRARDFPGLKETCARLALQWRHRCSTTGDTGRPRADFAGNGVLH